MHDDHPHPLLAQIPLTLSPFLSLPHPVPLPYSYVTLPSTLPTSILQNPNYITSSSSSSSNQNSSASASPDTILSSCRALQHHLYQLESDARQALKGWEEQRAKEDLAEKRRVAPGWLDSGVRVLKPEVVVGKEEGEVQNIMDDDPQQREAEVKKAREGEELDRVFGGLKV